MGKRGRPPLNIRKYEIPTNVDPNRVLMTPEEVSRLSAKNSRTMMKILQLLEVKNMSASTLTSEKKGLLEDKMDALKSRLNRRLKKCANWSDERLSNRVPTYDKKRKMEMSYKNPDSATPKWVPCPRLLTEEEENPHPVYICTGSQNSYTEEYNAQLLEKGEITTRVPVSRFQQRKTVFNAETSTLYKGSVDTWAFLTEEEITELEANNPEELKRRRRLDNDHRYYMKKKAEGRL